MKHDNYDWILVFKEDQSKVRENTSVTEELLTNRVLFDQVREYLKSHPEKYISTLPDGACGCYTKKFIDETDEMQ